MSFDVRSSISYNTADQHAYARAMEVASGFDVPKLFYGRTPVQMNGSIPAIIKLLEEVVGRKIVKTIPAHLYLLVQFDNLVVVLYSEMKMFLDTKRTMKLGLIGDIEEVCELNEKLRERFPRENNNHVNWYYATDKGPQSTIVDLNHRYETKDEYFPFIPQGIAQFQKDFLESDENVLLLIGEPGCGKTSFIRDMIQRNDLSCAVTYDELLMNMDSFFIEFMNRGYDLLVIEDADVILRDREGGNKIMNKLLNASDGLIQTKKKIVFTANITHINDVDAALIRPGRCFGAITFREMTFSETMAAAKAAGLPEPEEAKTLSKLFAKGSEVSVPRRMGFGG